MNWDILTPSGKHEPSVGIEPDFYPGGIPRKSYDSVSALSCTVIKQWMQMHRTPSKFNWWLKHRWMEDKTPALVLGGFLDALLLDPDAAKKYAVIPPDAPHRPTGKMINAKKPSDSTVASIAFWKKFDEDNAGKNILTNAQYQAAGAMAVSIKQAATNAEVFDHCHKAVVVASLFGEPWKCEFDLWHPVTSHIGDVKTCAEINPEEFGKAFFHFGYHVQATIYLLLARAAGFDKEIFSFLCVESSEPWTAISFNFRPFANKYHKAIYEKTAMDIASAVVSLKLAVADNFVDPLGWDDIIIPGWEIAKTRQHEQLLTL